MIVIPESGETRLAPGELTHEQGDEIHSTYHHLLDIEYPSKATGHQWVLRGKGWVGQVACGMTQLYLEPKASIRAIFELLSYSQSPARFNAFIDDVRVDTIGELFDSLASLFAHASAAIIQRGPYRSYRIHEEELMAPRGRIDIRQCIRRPARIALVCRYEEQDIDNIENRILVATLHALISNPSLATQTRALCADTLRRFGTSVALTSASSTTIASVRYNALNAHYQTAHRLASILLKASTPSHKSGPTQFPGFAIHMPTVFEEAVATALRAALPEYIVIRQQSYWIDVDLRLRFIADIVVKDARGRTLAVADTKHKMWETPKAHDIAQIAAYCKAFGANTGVLIYPRKVEMRSLSVDDITIATAHFPLDRPVAESGALLARQIRAKILREGGPTLL